MMENLQRFTNGTYQEVERIASRQEKFQNLASRMVSLSQPEVEPAGGAVASGWTKQIDEDGVPYYFNEQTGESSWNPPGGIDAAELPGVVSGRDEGGDGSGPPMIESGEWSQ